MSRGGRRAPQRSERQRLDDLRAALADAGQYLLDVDRERFLEDPLLRALARDVLNRFRTGIAKLSPGTRKQMPEVPFEDVANTRNLAVYEYATDADELVLRTIRNSYRAWSQAVERAIADHDGLAVVSALLTRADGSLAASRPVALCGREVL